jgi:hypothetical protein
LEKKPARGGMPASPTAPTRKVTVVTSILGAIPPILRMSCSPLRPWMTLPAPRKRSALKKAWVTRWKMPAA